jgi:hypothetical protein
VQWIFDPRKNKVGTDMELLQEISSNGIIIIKENR